MNLNLTQKLSAIALSSAMLLSLPHAANAENAVTQWNDAALQAIRTVKPGPPMVARALAITNTCMFDAFAAYDARAQSTQGSTPRRPGTEHTAANKQKAISFAAYKCLANLFPSEIASFNAAMAALGYDPNENTGSLDTPAGVGNAAADAVIAFRSTDGSNQANGYADTTGYQPVNTPDTISDPNHWQPLQVNGNVQQFIAPHWGGVTPYALKSGAQFRHAVKPPADYVNEPERYKTQAQQILEYSANLSDEKKVIAEYWMDGPSSEFPPGHWVLFSKFVSERDGHSLDQDVKMFFALSNASFDAGIVSWDIKRFYDYVRPVTAIHYLYAGQQIRSWQGVIDGADWQPYQPANVITPPFPEYISGHSIYSAASAETLKLFTKNDYFGASALIPAGSSKVEPGLVPANDTVLYWATFSDAADEAGISRRYGGIHFIDGDLESRKLGRLVAQQAWDKSLSYFNDPNYGNSYDGDTRTLTLEDVDVNGKHFSAILTNIGNWQFALVGNATPFTGAAATATARYDTETGIVSIPKLLYAGNLYSVTLQRVTDTLFSLEQATPL